MLLVGIWNGGLSDESVEEMANSNLHVMRFLGLLLEDDVPDHSVLSRFRTWLTAADAWDRLMNDPAPRDEKYQSCEKEYCTLATGNSRLKVIFSAHYRKIAEKYPQTY